MDFSHNFYAGGAAPQPYQFIGVPPLTPSHSNNSAASENYNNQSPPVRPVPSRLFFVSTHNTTSSRLTLHFSCASSVFCFCSKPKTVRMILPFRIPPLFDAIIWRLGALEPQIHDTVKRDASSQAILVVFVHQSPGAWRSADSRSTGFEEQVLGMRRE